MSFAEPEGHAERMRTLHEISEEKREAAEMVEMQQSHDWAIWEDEQARWWDNGAADGGREEDWK